MQNISIRLIQRVAVGTMALLLFFALALISHHALGSWLFLGTLAGVIGLALWEYYEMAVTRGYAPSVRIGFWTAVAYLVALFLSLHYHEMSQLYAIVLLSGVLVFFCQNYQQPQEELIANSAITLFGFVYIAVSLGYLLMITYYPFQEISQDGRWWLIYAVVVTKMTDVGAYIFGKWRGKTPLAPQVSPNKSVEGSPGRTRLRPLCRLPDPRLTPHSPTALLRPMPRLWPLPRHHRTNRRSPRIPPQT